MEEGCVGAGQCFGALATRLELLSDDEGLETLMMSSGSLLTH